MLPPAEAVPKDPGQGGDGHRSRVLKSTAAGAIFRSAAGLGVDAVLVTPRCADALYRRSVRVSMGTVFQVPWTRLETWPGGLADLRDAGFTVAALALAEDVVSLADLVVRIPMAAGVDSLNVAAASAVAFWATRT